MPKKVQASASDNYQKTTCKMQEINAAWTARAVHRLEHDHHSCLLSRKCISVSNPSDVMTAGTRGPHILRKRTQEATTTDPFLKHTSTILGRVREISDPRCLPTVRHVEKGMHKYVREVTRNIKTHHFLL